MEWKEEDGKGYAVYKRRWREIEQNSTKIVKLNWRGELDKEYQD
jgi:hypothetical protein